MMLITIFVFTFLFLTILFLSVSKRNMQLNGRIERYQKNNIGVNKITNRKNEQIIYKSRVNNKLLHRVSKYWEGIINNINKIGLKINGYKMLYLLAIIYVSCLVLTIYFKFNPWFSIIAFLVIIGALSIVIHAKASSIDRKMIMDLPDSLDVIVRGIKSGLPISETIRAIADEQGGQIGKVFSEVNANVAIGKSINESVTEMAQKYQAAELRFLAISLSIQQETGGNLSEILANLAGLIRRREQLKLKIRALSSEARASALIIGSLPFIMGAIITIVSPDYIAVLFDDRRGNVLLFVGLLSICTGCLVIARMIRFKI